MNELSPEMKGLIFTVLGVVGKMMLDSVIKIFQNTLSTPARVKVLEEQFKKEFDDMKAKVAVQDQAISKNWDRYNEIEKRMAIVESHDERNDSRKAA